MTPSETTASAAVAVELERLRSDFGLIARDVGEIKTACAVLVERSTRTERDVRDLRADTEAQVAALRTDLDRETGGLRADVEGLKRAQWTATGVVLGVAALLGGGAGYLAQALGG